MRTRPPLSSICTQLDKQDTWRYPREMTLSPDTTKEDLHLLSLTVDDRIGGRGDNLDLLLEDVHPQMINRINPRRIQVEQFLGSGVASVTQRNGDKWCQTESTRIDYTITRIHILHSPIRYQNDQSPGFRQAPRLRSDPRNRLWMRLPSEGPPFSARFECQTIFPSQGETRIDPSAIGFTRHHHSQGLACRLTNSVEAETSQVPATITFAAPPPGRCQISGASLTCLPVS